jgi:hypothetical protein
MGMNLIKLIAADLLFLVIANNKPVTNAFGIYQSEERLKLAPLENPLYQLLLIWQAQKEISSNRMTVHSFLLAAFAWFVIRQ